MATPLVKKTAARVNLSIEQVDSIVSSFNSYMVWQLQTMPKEETIPYLGLVDMSPSKPSLGLARRIPFSLVIKNFSDLMGIDYDIARSVLYGYRDQALDEILKNSRLTIAHLGVFKIQDGRIRFWSSCAFNRNGGRVVSRVNPWVRDQVNSILGENHAGANA